MVAIGIDYGTSNSEVVYFDGQQHHFIQLDPAIEGANKIRSSVFVHYENDLPLPPADVIEAKVGFIQQSIQQQIEKAKAAYYEASDPREQQIYSNKVDTLRGEFHNRPALQRRAIQLLMKDRTVQDLSLKQLVDTGQFSFGEEGFSRYLTTPDKGRLIYSPKNFLGASLVAGQQQAFEGMIAKQLAYFRSAAEKQLGCTVRKAVIGRPVRFHGTRGEAGNTQAISIMTEASKLAGFERVEFLEEPIAAAYKIERALEKATNVLVVDIGGGTTDVCCIKLSPDFKPSRDRQQDVLAVTGTRLGGMECDKSLITKTIAPTMGQGLTMQNGFPVPPTYFSDMCAVDDIPKLNRFFSDEYGLDIAQTMSIVKNSEPLGRLLTVQVEKLSARLVNSSRMAKELLSSQPAITLPLNYIEQGYSVPIDEKDLHNSMQSWLRRIKGLVNTCIEQSAEAPEKLFITGGMSLSPIVRQTLHDNMLPDLPMLEGDAFNSVCEGLAIHAARINALSLD